jgi:Arc/MetJ-type ribon-helix-helix transcriptional regulator
MGTLSVRTDDAMETALRALAQEYGSRAEAVRYALLFAYKEKMIARAKADAARAEADPDDRAETLA